MAVSFSGIAGSNVTISGAVTTTSSIAVPNADQTVVGGHYSGTGASATIYTIPANKIFYLYGFSIRAGAAGVHANLYETDGTTIRGQYGVLTIGDFTINNFQSPAIVLTAGQFLKFNVHASGQIQWWGILQDV